MSKLKTKPFRLFGGSIRTALDHALTEYDRRQERTKRYNPYALAQYLRRVDEVCADIDAGAHPRDALCAAFTGPVLKAALKAVNAAPPTNDELSGFGKPVAVAASEPATPKPVSRVPLSPTAALLLRILRERAYGDPGDGWALVELGEVELVFAGELGLDGDTFERTFLAHRAVLESRGLYRPAPEAPEYAGYAEVRLADNGESE